MSTITIPRDWLTKIHEQISEIVTENKDKELYPALTYLAGLVESAELLLKDKE